MSSKQGAMAGGSKSFVCPIDKRVFSTRKALAQHRSSASHSAAMPTQAAKPKRVAPKRAKSSPWRETANTRLSSGSDLLPSSKEVMIKDKAGAILADIPIHPTMPGTRLGAEASLWCRWRPMQLVLHVLSSAGSMTSGAYTVGFTYEPGLKMAQGPSAISRVAAMRPSSTANIHTNTTFAIPCDSQQKWYSVNGREEADSVHGRIYVILTSPLGQITAESKISFQFKLVWRILFEGASLPDALESTFLYADQGYEGYFTDSVSDWAEGKKLSLKHTTGGNLVPFSDAETGIVYKLDATAKLQYNLTASTFGAITHATLIHNYYVKAFAVFSDVASARKYAKSGDYADALGYVQAGPTVVPANPAWVRLPPVISSSLELEVNDLREQLAEMKLTIAALSPGSSASSFAGVDEQDFVQAAP